MSQHNLRSQHSFHPTEPVAFSRHIDRYENSMDRINHDSVQLEYRNRELQQQLDEDSRPISINITTSEHEASMLKEKTHRKKRLATNKSPPRTK